MSVEVPPPAAVTVPRKTRCPTPFGLARARLQDVLLAPDAPGQALVVAPPGAGKTTLLSGVAAASGGGVGWFAAGAEDRREPALVRYLGHALLGEAADRLAPDAGVDTLLAALGDEPSAGTTLLVVDDLHELAGTEAEDALERFLLLRPPSLRVFLGSRRPPSFNTSRMLACGDLVELSGDDLRFRSWEVEDLFRTVYREPLTPEAAALLCRRVGGLAAALQLFHLSVRNLSRAEREAEIVRLNGRSRLIRSYLARTVLDGLTRERRDFLLRTSPLGVLDGPLCDALLGRPGSAATLRELEREQLFTTTPDGGLSYRYHQVLRDHLEVVLEDELPAGEVTALHARAARLLERAGYGAEALRAYRRAGDWGAAARLVRGRSPVTDPDGGALTTGALVQAEQNDPWLAVARIRQLLRQGSVEAALLGLRQVEASVDDPDLAAHCAHERLQASVWRGAGAPSTDPARSPLVALRSLTRTVHPPPRAGGGAPEWALVPVVADLLSGRLAQARVNLDRHYPLLVDGTWPKLAAGLLSALTEMGAPAQRRHSCATLEDLSLSAEVQGYPWLARVAKGLQACLVLETAGQPWRIAACRSTIQACQRDGDPWGELVVRVVTAVALARRGGYVEARSQLDHAAAVALTLDAPVLGLWARALTLAVTGAAEGEAARTVSADRVLSGQARRAGLDAEVVLAACRVAVRRRAAPPPAPGPRVGRVPVAETPGESRVTCLGGFRLVHGTELDLMPLRPRARLLLMLLALHHGADVHRERLIDSLWPDAPLEAGTRRLQVAVSSVRRLLEDRGLAATAVLRHGDAYRLQLPGASVDVQQLEGGLAGLEVAARAGDLVTVAERAGDVMRVYHGDLLPEVGAAEWVVAERERLRLGTAAALSTAARSCVDHGRPDLAMGAARRVVELDPLRDTAWLTLARIQQELGDHSAAQATLTEHDRVCDQLSVPVLAPPTAPAPPVAGRARG